ncbi:DUF4349 domain-containing protein [Amycolatopsis nigrescens]|uniref:DUF4349 domain-containing protein n=1 Tax=Amycolatopsis nigrescens TaxID=381445 RepID=UPI00039F2E26|nr:DUF4349 domain-containing protein [Amycolatopsis nigrescens]
MRAKTVAGLALVCGVLLAGCSGGSGGSDNSTASVAGETGNAGSAEIAPAEPPSAQKTDPGQEKADESAGSTQDVPLGDLDAPGRQLARNARLGLTAPDVAVVADRAREITAAAGGYLGSERTRGESATLNLTVPSDRLDGTLAELSRLGTVTSREQDVQDVTEQVVDVQARLGTQRKSVERVRALLDRAATVSEITSIERELTSREAALESLQARQDKLAGSVATSKVALTVQTAGASGGAPEDDGFGGGFGDGWRAFLDFGSGVLTVLGAMAPFLLILGTPVVAAVWWVRRRRTRVRAQEAALPAVE